MTSYFRCLSLGITKLDLTEMSCTMPGGRQGSPQGQGKEERLQSSSAYLQDASPCWGSYSQISEPPSVLGHFWSLGTHQPVETSSQRMYPQTAGSSGHVAGGEQMVPLAPPQEPSSQSTRLRMTKAGGGTRLIARSAVSPALATSQPHKVSPAAGLGRRQVPVAGELSTGTWGSMAVGEQLEWERRPKTLNHRSPSTCPAFPVAPQTNVIKHWEQTDWTSA